MLRLLIAILFLLPNLSLAETFVGLGGSARFVKDEENNFKTKFPLLLYGGYKILPWAFALETLYYSDKSSSGASFHMEYEHYEVSTYVMKFFNYEDARAINPYAVGGLGFFQERLETVFMGNQSRDKSDINAIIKAGVGAWAGLGERGFINLEVKGLYSKDLSPEFIFDFVARAGLEF